MGIGEAQVGRGDAGLAGARQHVAHDLLALGRTALLHVAQDRGHGLASPCSSAWSSGRPATLSLGAWPSAAATLRLSSSVSRTMRGAVLGLHDVADRAAHRRRTCRRSCASMIHLSQRSWLMLGLRPPSMPAFLQAASSSTSDCARGLAVALAERHAGGAASAGSRRWGPACRRCAPGRRPPCAAPNFASSVAKWAWPFSIGTMVVSGADRRRDRLDRRVEVVGLAGQHDDVVGPALAALGHDLDRHDGVALRALHDQAFLAHLLGALLAQQEGDVDAGLMQARTPIAADRAGAENQDLHVLRGSFPPPSRRARSRGRRSGGGCGRDRVSAARFTLSSVRIHTVRMPMSARGLQVDRDVVGEGGARRIDVVLLHQLLVDLLVRLGPVVAGDDVEDRLEMMRHAQPLHDALGMRHVAGGEDDLAARQRRAATLPSAGLASTGE